MNAHPALPPTMTFTATDWDQVRAAFAASLLVDTPLSSLAQNLDGPDWPIKDAAETPDAYLDLSFDEMLALLALKGQSPERADFLILILKETLEFDAPFGDMVQQSAAAAERDNPLLKNLAKLGLAEEFPVTLTALGADTREFCRREKLATLGEFALFAQSIAQTVIVGGEFQRLLNALSHLDEPALATLLPVRPGTKGLHLAEALALIPASPEAAARAQEAAQWFALELATIEADLAAGGTLARHLAVLNNPAAEARAAALLRPHLRSRVVAAPVKRGLFARLFGG